MGSPSPAGSSRGFALVALALCACSGRAAPVDLTSHESTRSQPVLVVAQGETAAAAREALGRAGIDATDADAAARATELALATLTPMAREAAARLVQTLADRLEIRKNPFAEDLDDDDLEDGMRRAIRMWGPTLTSAGALAAAVHASGDGRMVIGLAPRCPPPDRALTCVPVWRSDAPPDEAGEVADRARFLAWPWPFVGIVSIPSQRREAVLSLRDRVASPESALALVLTETDLEGPIDDPWADALREQARRAVALSSGTRSARSELRPRLARLALAPPSGAAIPWLHLAPDQVAIVPRLGPAGQPDRVVREVEGELAPYGIQARWVHPPASPFR
jgi:hypothetical protein